MIKVVVDVNLELSDIFGDSSIKDELEKFNNYLITKVEKDLTNKEDTKLTFYTSCIAPIGKIDEEIAKDFQITNDIPSIIKEFTFNPNVTFKEIKINYINVTFNEIEINHIDVMSESWVEEGIKYNIHTDYYIIPLLKLE